MAHGPRSNGRHPVINYKPVHNGDDTAPSILGDLVREEFPAVKSLPVHLPGLQAVRFPAGAEDMPQHCVWKSVITTEEV
ncbi:uncharacterized protein N7515_003386 [Penicillium bovifimosum]|uniref:Uncharacterized protein n=1 Tax=Penicillium bovifimosum TaxID=126998 RepID=A0A9W9L4L5_9EURO|nr:uncharacterized protein N7515_003386 [Penicillium bovifimosum]KAJ5138538.1 hypothetical protein N7515_003386 [Penicillium bovifimosum]